MIRTHGIPFVLLALACLPSADSDALLGTVERTTIEISAPVSEVLVEVNAAQGTRVEPGQLLARLDEELAVAVRDAARARLDESQAARREAAPELKRVEGLRRAGAASLQELDRAKRAYQQAVAREQEARAVLAQTEKRLAQHQLTSPVAGIVDQLPYDPGERVPSGGVVVVILADDAPWVRVWLPARIVAHIAVGAGAELKIHGLDSTLRGRVLEIAHEPEFTPHFALTEREREHLVYETRVEILDPPAGLRPGLPAEVRLNGARTKEGS